MNMELVQINFEQNFAFAYLFKLLFGVSKSDDMKSKNDEDNCKDMPEAEDDTEAETIEVED